MELWTIICACGIPSALVGLAVWYFKRAIEKRDQEAKEHEKNLEQLVLMMLQSTRANSILCKATAEAVRDGHCNGNMTAALEVVDAAAQAEKEFLLEKSIRFIFE